MTYILISIIILSIITIKYQSIHIHNTLNSIKLSNYHEYIQHNILSNNITNELLLKLQSSYIKWQYIWLPTIIINILISISTNILFSLYNYYNIYLIYSIIILTTSTISPTISFKQFPWLKYYNNILIYHSQKLQLILVNNILIENKNILTNNSLNIQEIHFISQYSHKLINISHNIQDNIRTSQSILNI